MSARGGTWILWLTAMLTVPVPFFMIEHGWVPAMRLLLFAVVTSSAAISDGDMASRWIAGLFVVQALLYCVVLYRLSRLVAHRVARISSAGARRGVLGALVVALLVLGLADVFVMPLSGSGPRGNLFHLFD